MLALKYFFIFRKESKNIACDATVGTKKMILYVQIECQFGYLWCLFKMAYANMRGDMPLWTKIYAIFRDRNRVRFPEQKSKAHQHIKIDAMLSSGFFPGKCAGDGPAFWISTYSVTEFQCEQMIFQYQESYVLHVNIICNKFSNQLC